MTTEAEIFELLAVKLPRGDPIGHHTPIDEARNKTSFKRESYLRRYVGRCHCFHCDWSNANKFMLIYGKESVTECLSLEREGKRSRTVAWGSTNLHTIDDCGLRIRVNVCVCVCAVRRPN